MLYIFWVERGVIITLHVDIATDTVANLKVVLSRKIGIAEENQVLLINGGESLQNDQRVARYQSGTDANPIFLFNRAGIDSDDSAELSPRSSGFDIPDEDEAADKIRQILNLPNQLNSMVAATQLAQQFHDYAMDLNKNCSSLVHEQQLQHQGWQAVMANLEDVISASRRRMELFQQNYKAYLETRDEKLELLENFGSCLEVLSKIKLFKSTVKPTVSPLPKSDSGFQSALPQSTSEEPEKVEDNTVTIFDWISSKDPEHSLLAVAESCQNTINYFDGHALDELMEEWQKLLEHSNDPNGKEIKGLSSRLFDLDQLLEQTKKVVLEQKEMAEQLYKLQNQATLTKDPAVLKEIATAYPQSLERVLQNHRRLYDINKRCFTSKQEVCNNLHQRLRWVVALENNIIDVDDKVRIYFENLRRIKRLTLMLQQVSTASRTYVVAAQEVIRRRRFSQEFLAWANEIASIASTVYKEERDARRSFHAEFGNHFLLSLFPGLQELPPAFALEAPEPFDTKLPIISHEELKYVIASAPELESYLTPMVETSPLFILRNSTDVDLPQPNNELDTFKAGVQNRIYELQDNMRITVSDFAAIRMEVTDFVESYSKFVNDFASINLPTLSSRLESGHRNLLHSSRQQVERLQAQLADARSEIEGVKRHREGDLAVREDVERNLEEKERGLAHRERILGTVVGRCEECKARIVQLRVSLHGTREWVLMQQEESRQWFNEFGQQISSFVELFQKAYRTTERLRVTLNETKREGDQKFEELRAQIVQDHAGMIAKVEEESEAALEVCREDLMADMERRLAAQAEELKAKHEAEIEQLRAALEAEKTEAISKLRAEQEESMFSSIRPKAGRSGSALSEQLFEMERSFMVKDVTDMTESHLSSSVVMSSPTLSHPSEPRSGVSLSSTGAAVAAHQGCVTLSSCNVGDLVLFQFNSEYRQYSAYLPFKKSLYLLHADSQTTLGLVVPEIGDPSTPWLIAEVTGKEYVLTRKVPNRYKLQVGTKFFRVQARQWIVDAVGGGRDISERRSDFSIS